MSTYDTIKEAIENKKSLEFTYKNKTRLMSPHVLGNKGDKEQALFYQYGGESSSGLSSDQSKNWRCIDISGISEISINEDDFYTSDNHNQVQTCVDDIDVEIDY